MNFLDQARKRLAELGTHTLDDVLADIEHGFMLSFTEKDSWAVVHPIQYPRKRVAELFLVVGEEKDMKALFDQVLAWSKANNVEEIWGWCRAGWVKYMRHPDQERDFGFKAANRALYRMKIGD